MIAVDTNVLVYAVDANEPTRGHRALALLRELESQPTVLLWQVVCEFGAALLRRKLDGPSRVGIPEMLAAWMGIFPLAVPSAAMVPTAWRIRDEHQVSYWDSLLLAACIDAGVTRLYSEDVPGKPVIEGVEIINPFA